MCSSVHECVRAYTTTSNSISSPRRRPKPYGLEELLDYLASSAYHQNPKKSVIVCLVCMHLTYLKIIKTKKIRLENLLSLILSNLKTHPPCNSSLESSSYIELSSKISASSFNEVLLYKPRKEEPYTFVISLQKSYPLQNPFN